MPGRGGATLVRWVRFACAHGHRGCRTQPTATEVHQSNG
ncbi:hypothetical protein C4K02_3570 [Pseudomonas synxantha]|nr:hypothetical protein C4K02_3570 [Pseudomonas synxantha]